MSKIKFDFIGITESQQQIGKDFIVNVDMEGYHKYNQLSKSTSGGVVIYVNSNLDHSKTDELSKTEDDFESLWIEIKGSRRKPSYFTWSTGLKFLVLGLGSRRYYFILNTAFHSARPLQLHNKV